MKNPPDLDAEVRKLVAEVAATITPQRAEHVLKTFQVLAGTARFPQADKRRALYAQAFTDFILLIAWEDLQAANPELSPEEVVVLTRRKISGLFA